MKDTCFDMCPRCGGEWDRNLVRFIDGVKHNVIRCLNCRAVCDERSFSLKCFLKYEEGSDGWSGGHNLVWDTEVHVCFYADIIDAMNEKMLQLPWLPFDISKEKLKLYITFS